jgi:integrase
VAVLPSVEQHCGASTINRKLSALNAFYVHAARHGVDVGELLVTWQPTARRGSQWKPFLHHVSKGTPTARRTIALKAPIKLPRVLTVAEAQAILDACERLRDRLLFAVLHDTGVRIGEALGLRHCDIAAAERELTVCRRINENRARAKSVFSRTIPVSAELVRLYADYLHGEYGDLDSDYVFVNLWGRPHGQPLGYPAVYDLVRRLRRRTGIDFDPHWWRHTAATRMLRDGVPLEFEWSLSFRTGIASCTLSRLEQLLGVLWRDGRQALGDVIRCFMAEHLAFEPNDCQAKYLGRDEILDLGGRLNICRQLAGVEVADLNNELVVYEALVPIATPELGGLAIAFVVRVEQNGDGGLVYVTATREVDHVGNVLSATGGDEGQRIEVEGRILAAETPRERTQSGEQYLISLPLKHQVAVAYERCLRDERPKRGAERFVVILRGVLNNAAAFVAVSLL